MKNLNAQIIIMLIALFAVSRNVSFAQEKKSEGNPAEKVVVGITPLEYSARTANPTYVSMIYDRISLLLQRNSAVDLVDRGTWEKLQEERELLKTEPFILSKTIEQGRSVGAELDFKFQVIGNNIVFTLY